MEIKFDKRNYRKHSDSNKRKIKKSLQECGAGRSVLVDADDTLIAGNGVFEQAQAMGIPTRVIETDGTELVVVKRTDLRTDDDKRKLLAMADNATSDNVEWDFEMALQDFNEGTLNDWDIKLPTIKATELLSDLTFEDMYYNPKEKPNICLKDCVNLDKFNAKIAAIEAMDLSEEQKSVLKLFAYRFIKIDFESVANYYAFNATPQEQEAIERLRLVLVDGALDGFVEDGLIRMHEDIIADYQEAYG